MSYLQTKLEKIKNTEGANLYNHLCNVFSKITLDNPKNAYDVLEDYSHHIQLLSYDFKNHDSITDEQTKKVVDEEQSQEFLNYLEKSRKLLDQLKQGESEEAQEPVGPIGYVPNFMEEARWFEWAGVGFGEDESYRIFKSLSQLSFKKQATSIKLWGKIICSEKDYYVAIGEVPAGGDAEGLAPDVEAPGTGVNKASYFVTTSLSEDWTMLPLVKPQQIVIARNIKYVFTGNLDKKIITNPHFDGTEAELLKCQIVRIQHTTDIMPKGPFQITEDTNGREIQENQDTENFKPPTYKQLTQESMWVHNPPRILRGGRLAHFMPDPIPNEMDPEAYQKILEGEEPYDARLKAITDDLAPCGYKSAWKLNSYGDQTGYTSKDNLPVNNGVIAIKNIYWPGSITVYSQGRLASLYIGNGFKIQNELFYPNQPEMVLEEQDNMVEEAEVNIAPEVEVKEDENAEKEEE